MRTSTFWQDYIRPCHLLVQWFLLTILSLPLGWLAFPPMWLAGLMVKRADDIAVRLAKLSALAGRSD